MYPQALKRESYEALPHTARQKFLALVHELRTYIISNSEPLAFGVPRSSSEGEGFGFLCRMKVHVKPGQRFNRLTYIMDVDKGDSRHRMAKFICTCGKITIIILKNAKRGNTKSCGCLYRKKIGDCNRTHGKSHIPEYGAWRTMQIRCFDVNDRAYRNYGGRGITVCERWLQLENFLDDMGLRPSDKHSLDRINNDGNYEPGNCRWATKKEQLRNTRRNRHITIDGVTRILTEWGEATGLGYQLIANRLQKGWSEQEAIKTPKLCQRRS